VEFTKKDDLAGGLKASFIETADINWKNLPM
jgi:hypothetical protein